MIDTALFYVFLFYFGICKSAPRRHVIMKRSVQGGTRLWTRKIVPYEVDDRVWNVTHIEEAVQYFNALSCVKWRRKSEADKDFPYVIFKPDTVCRSEVGNMGYLNGQFVYIARHCSSRPIIIHEMLHVMGFNHEMRRYDRDDFIVIHWDNIMPGFEKYFSKIFPEETISLHQQYDSFSVMHYGSYAYSMHPNKKTITLVGSDMVIPEQNEVTESDVAKLKVLYDCRDNAQQGWSQWSTYEACNDKCVKRKYRFCFSPAGNSCLNNSEANTHEVEFREISCSSEECSYNGWWSKWSAWSSCNVFCGRGENHRSRTCTDPPPRGEGRFCIGNQNDTQICYRGSCNKMRDDCEFDNDGLCRWTAGQGWERSASGGSKGPVTDVSYLNGYYMLLSEIEISTLSLSMSSNKYHCLKFYHASQGNTTLLVKLRFENNYQNQYWTNCSGTDAWINTSIRLKNSHSLRTVEFLGTLQDKENDFLAIDDIFFTTEDCYTKNAYEIVDLTTVSLMSKHSNTDSQVKPSTSTTYKLRSSPITVYEIYTKPGSVYQAPTTSTISEITTPIKSGGFQIIIEKLKSSGVPSIALNNILLILSLVIVFSF